MEDAEREDVGFYGRWLGEEHEPAEIALLELCALPEGAREYVR